jgi:hypothetical protein
MGDAVDAQHVPPINLAESTRNPSTHLASSSSVTNDHQPTTTMKPISLAIILLSSSTAQAWWCNSGVTGTGYCEGLKSNGNSARTFCCSEDKGGEFTIWRNVIGRQNVENGGNGCGDSGRVLCSVNY